MFNFFEELFAPGRKHVAEEQKRLELSRVDVAAGDPARGPIDLTSGRVTVRAPECEGGSAPGHLREAPLEQDAVLTPRPPPGHGTGGRPRDGAARAVGTGDGVAARTLTAPGGRSGLARRGRRRPVRSAAPAWVQPLGARGQRPVGPPRGSRS
ncbi:hypothetical protein EQG64_25855 [Streptomyces sp. S6]|nr:hypothetical protein EQG64_25855 [Streptomyces sp. S6]